MLIAERHSRLLESISRRGIVDLETLARELDVSQSTVRRDIDALEQRSLVKRTHGGVIWVGDRSPSSPTRPYAFDQRMDYRVGAKRTIARAAKQLIEADDTILIDGGTTTFYLAQQLVGMPLQIVTNSLPISNLFLNDENVELIITGGLMYPRYGVMLGPLAEHMLQNIHARTLFFSVAGINEGTLYNQNLLLVEAERRMMQQAQQVVLLVDSSKFAQQALGRLCTLDEVDIVVVDDEVAPEHRSMLKSAGCQVIIAK